MTSRSFSMARAAVTVAVLAAAAGSSVAAQQFDVFAKANSTATSSMDATPLDTGITFAAGQGLSITASGSWNGGACGDLGPNGDVGNCIGSSFAPGIPYYALVGKFGAGGDYFLVGSSFNGVAASSGNLFLAYADSDSFNNSGFVTALVSTAAVPEPASAALMLGGAGLLAAATRRRRG